MSASPPTQPPTHLDQVEAHFQASELVDAVVVFLKGRARPLALLQVDWSKLEGQNADGLIDQDLVQGLRRELQRLHEAAPPGIRPAGFLVLGRDFTIDNGPPGAHLGTDRASVERYYKPLLEQLEAEVPPDSAGFNIRLISVSDQRALAIAALPRLTHLPLGRLSRSIRLIGVMVRAFWWAALDTLSGFKDTDDPVREAARKQRLLIRIAMMAVRELGALKGPMMKFGQLLSYVGDGAFLSIREELRRLQDATAPLDPQIIRRAVEASLGHPISTLFTEWADVPLAAASISQVHRARLPDGREVAVKVKYPGIETAIRSDFAALRLLAPILGRLARISNLPQLLAELQRMVIDECDFEREATYQIRFRRIFDGHPTIRVPWVDLDRTSRDVLTMEYVDGLPFDAFVKRATQEQKNRAGAAIWEMASISVHRYLLFNADPHPGNYLFAGDQVWFLDFGFVKRFSDEFIRLQNRHALSAIRQDLPAFRQATVELGYVSETNSSFDFETMLRGFRDVLYASFADDRPFQFTQRFVSHEIRTVLGDRSLDELEEIAIHPDALALTRLFGGLHGVMALLQAEGNWHQVLLPLMRELEEAGPIADAGRSIDAQGMHLPRLQLFEFDDQPWVKGAMREAFMDVLDLAHRVFKPFAGMVQPLHDWAERSGHHEVLDLGSGGGGHIEVLFDLADRQHVSLPTVALSDLMPNLKRYRQLQEKYGSDRVRIVDAPLSVTVLASRPERLWMISTAFHHFSPPLAREVIEDAVHFSDGLFILEPYERTLSAAITEALFGFPFAVVTPFFASKFGWKKLLLSTVLPIVPLMIVWDGVTSILRTYRLEELRAFVPAASREHFDIVHGRNRLTPTISSSYFGIVRRNAANPARPR